jgi:hypothetical protein
MVEEARNRRRLLKVLGSTVAWVLLEYDRPYIRAFSTNLDPGFISGKEGLRLEEIALRASFSQQNYAGVLHDLTDCLRIGDLSVVRPDHSILTLELKTVKNSGKKGGRDHRQYARGRNIREYYEIGRSTKVIPGWTMVRYRSRGRDRYNWRQLRQVISHAEMHGVASKVVEKCLTYIAFKADMKDDELNELQNTVKKLTNRLEKPSDAVVGFSTERVEIPWMVPIPCFDIPLKHKESLLFGDIELCVIVDLRRLADALTRHGSPSKMIRDRRKGFVSTKIPGFSDPTILGEGLISRLLYEFAAADTIIGYTREVSRSAKKLTSQNEIA